MKIIKEKEYNDIISKIDKPTLIFFTSKNCPHCKTMEAILNKLKNDKMIILKINEENINLITFYQIRSFPTILTFDKGKIPKERLVGLKTKERMKESITLISKE